MKRAWRFSVIVLCASCVHAVTRETRATPVEAGVPTSFSASTPTTWDFGDATPRVTGLHASHAYDSAGRFVVRGFDSARADAELTHETVVTVESRPVFHLVPAEAQSLFVARSVDDLAPAIDFVERLFGPASTQRWLEGLPLAQFVLDQDSGRRSLLDPSEGLGVFTLSATDVTVSFVGVAAPRAALTAMQDWLREQQWQGGPTVFTKSGRQLEVFVSRGVLYAAAGTEGDALVEVRVAQAPAAGLEADPRLAEALNDLPSGAWVVLARPEQTLSPWSLFSGALTLAATDATLHARFNAPGPLWAASPAPSGRLLEHAPEGPLAALSFGLPATTLASLVVGSPGTARRGQALGPDVEKGLEALGGHADAVAYFDATAFYRETIARDGRPTPRGTVLLEAAVKDGLGFGHWLDAIMQHHWFPVSRAQEPNLNLWRFEVLGQPVELALTASTLFGKAGEPIRDRASTDLAAAWGKAFDGAFGPGHVSALFDVGQLRRELMTPRFVAGVDPRRVVTAQAIAQTLLDGLTQLDLVVVDLAPDGRGATMQALFRTRAVERAP